MPYWPDTTFLQVLYVVAVLWMMCFFTLVIAAFIDVGIGGDIGEFDDEDDCDRPSKTRACLPASAEPDGQRCDAGH